ncbi:MAG: radical SAM protein [Chloroflexi bacterium]|nr:radical SAM protein [Chloroflexota bacterium]
MFDPTPVLISWNVTKKCNLSCLHCYRDAGEAGLFELTTLEGKHLLESIAKAGFRVLVLSGGEPLLRADIYELIEKAVELKLRVVMGTNGTLLTEGTVMKLKRAGVARVGISIDSLNTAVHDEFRRFEGALQKSVDGMQACRVYGLPFQVHTTVTKRNVDEIFQITDFAVRAGAEAHHIFFLVPTGRASEHEELFLDKKDYEIFLQKLVEKMDSCPIVIKPTCAPQFMRIASNKGIRHRFKKGCLAGVSYCVILPGGEVHPCPYFPLSLGNVRDVPFEEIWAGNDVFHELRRGVYHGKCGICHYQEICGGCRARAYFETSGDFLAEDPVCVYSPDEVGDDLARDILI